MHLLWLLFVCSLSHAVLWVKVLVNSASWVTVKVGVRHSHVYRSVWLASIVLVKGRPMFPYSGNAALQPGFTSRLFRSSVDKRRVASTARNSRGNQCSCEASENVGAAEERVCHVYVATENWKRGTRQRIRINLTMVLFFFFFEFK